MNKTKRPKLTLKGETIRVLTIVEQKAVDGGRQTHRSVELPCYSTLTPGSHCW